MNLIQRALVKTLTALRAYPSPQPLTWDSLMREMGGYRDNLAGVSVNEYTALNYSPVWCGVSTLSRDIAKLPLILYKNLPNGGKERFTSHRLYRILHDEWNPEMTSYKARETMQALCVLYGNAYAEIVRTELGYPAGLYPIVPTRVTPLRDDAGRLVYRVTQPSGGQKFMTPGNMIHLSALSTDGIIGHALAEHACESIGLGLATEKFGAAFFGNGATFGGVVQLPQAIDEKQKADLRTAIEAVHRGVERAHKILMLGNGATFTPRGTTPNEGQYIETRKFQIAEVARWLGMPNHKLGDLENAHFTNIEEQELQYYVGTVSGWLEMWEQELSRKLIAPLEYSQQTIEHKLEGVLRGDSTKRADFYAKMWNIGAFSQNDILRLENQNPIGPAGDVHMVPLNMIPVERYGEWIDAQLKAKTAPPPAPKALPAGKTQGTVAELKRALLEAQAKADALVATAVEAAQKAGDSAEWRAMAEQAKAEAATAARDVTDAREFLRLATEQRDAILAERQAETVARELAERAAAALQSKAEQLEVAELEAHEALTAAETTVATQRAALEAAEQRTIEQAQAITVAQAQAAETATRATAVDSINTDLAARVAALTAADAALEQTQLKLAAVEATAQTQRAAELDRLTGVVTAHQALIVDVIQRAIRPEVERARRHQKTPETLQRWAEAFYQTHRDVCADLFWPAVLTHLAWQRSTEDAREAARTLAREHCEESERQLRIVIEGSDPEEFHVQLERTLARWEQERPQAVADKVLHNELAYLRSL